MTPINVLLIVLAIAVIFGIVTISAFSINKKRTQIKEKEDFRNGKKICVHTIEDCENCFDARHCVQRNGKGLLTRTKIKE